MVVPAPITYTSAAACFIHVLKTLRLHTTREVLSTEGIMNSGLAEVEDVNQRQVG